ncbi:MutS-related protein [Oceanithermus sp.]
MLDPESDRRLKPPPFSDDLATDLGLDSVFAVLSPDSLHRQAFREVLLSSVESSAQVVSHRQGVMRDVLERSQVVNDLWHLADQALRDAQKSHFGFSWRTPGVALFGAREVMISLLGSLRQLRDFARDKGGVLQSAGFQGLFNRIEASLTNRFFGDSQELMRELQGRSGYWIYASLEEGLRLAPKRLLRPPEGGVLSLLRTPRPVRTVIVPDRDISGARALTDLRDRGLAETASTLVVATRQVIGFFERLRYELSFFLAARKVYDELRERGYKLGFPRVDSHGGLSATGLFDPGLAFHLAHRVVDNDLEAGGRRFLLISGANKGGKTTFLRALGLAQLFMQAGIFAPARSFSADLRSGIFSHFVRPEDEGHQRGKFEEELARLHSLLEAMSPGSLVLMNESFSSTYEREGASIAAFTIRVLLKKDIKVYFVTHLHDLIHQACGTWRDALCLHAERGAGGERTFKILPGAPSGGSHAADIYRRVFGEEL